MESGGKINSYRDLRVWQQAMDMVHAVYLASGEFPKDELYGLTSQLRRASVSVPANIAEGSVRRTTQEFIRYINIARGSLAEVETHVMIAQRLNYIPSTISSTLLDQTDQLGKMLQRLRQSLETKLTTPR